MGLRCLFGKEYAVLFGKEYAVYDGRWGGECMSRLRTGITRNRYSRYRNAGLYSLFKSHDYRLPITNTSRLQ